MFKSIKLLPGFACCFACIPSLQAATCPTEISATCDINTPQASGKHQGPLYTIKPASSPVQVMVSADRTASYRGPVFNIEGVTNAQLEVQSGIKLASDYDVIALPEGASIKGVNINGSLTSEHKRALYVGPKVNYGTISIATPATLVSHSENAPVISIDSTASGELTISNAQSSDKAPVLVYTTSPKYLWGADTPPAGVHKLTITAPLTSTATGFMDGVVAIGDPANINIAKALPVYQFSTIDIKGALTGGNAAIIQRHGAVTVSEKMIISAPVSGVNHALRFGQKAGDINQATFTAPEVVIEQPVKAYGIVISAEGEVNIGQFTIMSDVMVETAAPPDGYRVEEKAAFDFSHSTQPLNIVHKSGTVSGDIRGSGKNDVITYEGGALKSTLSGIQRLNLGPDQLELDPANTRVAVDWNSSTEQLSIQQGQVKASTLTGSKTVLTVEEKAHLHMTAPSSVRNFSLAGTLEADPGPEQDDKPYLEATGSITLNSGSSLLLNGSRAELDTPYRMLQSSSEITGELSSVVIASDRFRTVEKTRTAKTIDVTFHLKEPQELMAEITKVGITGNQANVTMANIEHGTATTRTSLVNSNDALLKRMAVELTPSLQYTTTSAQDTGRQVSSTIDNRIAMVTTTEETGISAGDSHSVQGVWGQVYGYKSKQDKKNDANGYEADNYGLTIGYDHSVEDNHLAGIALSLGKSKVDYTGSNKNDSDLITLSLYGAINRPEIGIEPQYITAASKMMKSAM